MFYVHIPASRRRETLHLGVTKGPYSENLPTQGEAVLNWRSASRLNLRETGLGASSSPASRAMCLRDTRSAPIRVVAARAPLACRTAASPPEARGTSG